VGDFTVYRVILGRFITAHAHNSDNATRIRPTKERHCVKCRMTDFRRDLEIRVRGHSRSLSLKCTVLEIFDFENSPDLEIRVKCHSRSLKVVPLDRLRMVSY